MSDSNEPKKETVRITLPPPESAQPGAERQTEIDSPGASATETEPDRATVSPVSPALKPAVRPPSFNSPPLRPSAPAVDPAGAPLSPPVVPSKTSETADAAPAFPAMPPRPRVLPPPPQTLPPAPPQSSAAAGLVNYSASASQAEPKKETARLKNRPEKTPPSALTVKMTKTQPLMTAPAAQIHSAPVNVLPKSASGFDAIPLPICWVIFGISAITLLIQIWNYLAS